MDQAPAQFGEFLFGPDALRDICYHADDTEHPVLFVEVRADVAFHPNYSTVWTYHTMADFKILLLRTHSGDR